ncbi:MAG: hypothetical protein O7C75_08765, partial [Verrucomicrobia bacterium]|nr:hypothetical protein [Verrucomicrobiota bacterium]
ALGKDASFYPSQRVLATTYFRLGRLAEAQYHMEAVLRKDPLSLRSNNDLVNVYAARGMWDKVFPLIEENLQHSDDLDHWKIRSAQAKYLQTGDRNALIAAIGAIPSFRNENGKKTWEALVRRDYSESLRQLKLRDADIRFRFLDLRLPRNMSMSIRNSYLLAALVHFELKEKMNWTAESEKAKASLQPITQVDPMADPDYSSNLAICYALEGDRERMEATIQAVREKTNTEIFRFSLQAACEMHIAIAYLVLGENDKAIETLEAASKMDGILFLNRELDLWFIFDRLRGNPRFDKLLED